MAYIHRKAHNLPYQIFTKTVVIAIISNSRWRWRWRQQWNMIGWIWNVCTVAPDIFSGWLRAQQQSADWPRRKSDFYILLNDIISVLTHILTYIHTYIHTYLTCRACEVIFSEVPIPHFNCFPFPTTYLLTPSSYFLFLYTVYIHLYCTSTVLKSLYKKKKILAFCFQVFMILFLFRVTGYLRTSVVHINIHTYILNISFGNIVLAIYRWTNLHTYIYVHTAYKVNYSIYNIFSARVKYKFSLSLPIV